ncbi:MAG: hypothetical protein JWO43_664 [Candidatus Adlerbacteria bacterium]|nr:hypothetical protein [Candidatus Adlerbacteria bacterium]
MRLAHYLHNKRRGKHAPSTFWLKVLNITVYVIGILGPLATIPQILKIYSAHDALGVSFTSWAIYTLFDIPWIIYALVHRERPLIICYTLWFIFNLLVAVGVVLYGNPWTL